MCLIYKTSQDFHDNSLHMYILRLRNYPVEISVNNNDNNNNNNDNNDNNNNNAPLLLWRPSLLYLNPKSKHSKSAKQTQDNV